LPFGGVDLEPPIVVEGQEKKTFWEAFCAVLGGADVTFPVPNPFRNESEVAGFIALPERRRRLFKKWCTRTSPSYLDPVDPVQPKWTDSLERSTPQACEQWHGKHIAEDSWDAKGQFIPVLPYDGALDAIVCSEQTPALFRESSRVPSGECQGDSGGPLVEGGRSSPLGAQYGVVSFGAPRACVRKSRLTETSVCGPLAGVCRCGLHIVECGSTCEEEEYAGWRYVEGAQNVYAKVAHYKDWLKQQESVCGKMRWSSEV